MNLFKNILLTGILILSGCSLVFGSHQIGSEMYYELIGEGGWPNSKLYRISFVAYTKCPTSNIPDLQIQIKPINFVGRDIRLLTLDSVENFDYNFVNCNSRPSGICYSKLFYSDTVSIREGLLPYDISSIQCCRDPVLDNIVAPDTFGTINHVVITDLVYNINNNSPIFFDSKFLSFCVNEQINFGYDVLESDGDQLIYKLCTPLGYMLGELSIDPPWPVIQYLLPTYATNFPLGQGGLAINPTTGQLTGTPEIVGNFVVGICVEEYRNGEYLGTIRQDIAMNVVPCTPLLTADLEAETTDAQNRAIYQLCNENTLTIENLSGPPESITGYKWYIDHPDQPLVSNDENPTFNFEQPGVYDGYLVVNPDSLCNDTAFFVVQVSELDTDFATTYDTCDIGPVAFSATPTSSAIISEYHWDFGDNQIGSELNPMHQFSNAGVYDVRLVVTDEYGCSDTMQQNLTWRPAPEVIVVSPDVAVGCTPLITTIENRSQPVDSTYQLYWEFGDGSTDSGLAPSHIYHNSGNYNVYLSITSPFGCFVDTVFENLIFADLPPKANFSWTLSDDPEKFTTFQFVDASERALGWNWIFDTLSLPDIRQEPNHVFPDTGYHKVTLIVEDQYGCFDTLTHLVDVVAPQTYFLPNAFTPNGDGLNDEFIGVGLTEYLQNFEMEIFDRWGSLVFSSQDVQKGWDGRNAPAGVYMYKVRYRVPREEKTEILGEVVLVR